MYKSFAELAVEIRDAYSSIHIKMGRMLMKQIDFRMFDFPLVYASVPLLV